MTITYILDGFEGALHLLVNEFYLALSGLPIWGTFCHLDFEIYVYPFQVMLIEGLRLSEKGLPPLDADLLPVGMINILKLNIIVDIRFHF